MRGAAPSHRGLALPLCLVGLLAVLVGLGTYATGALDTAENETVDLRFDLRGVQPVGDLAVVAIDEDSFSELQTTWPFPRTLHARVIDRLRRAGAKQIVYDVQFTEPSQRPEADLALFRAVNRAGQVVLATGESDERGRTSVLGGDKNLAAIGARAAAANFPADGGGVIRRYSHSIAKLPTIAAATAEQLGRPVSAERFKDGHARIDFRGPPGTVPTYSFSDVAEGRVDPALLRSRVVVVGASAPTLQDVHPAAVGGSRLMSGPELQANAIWTAVNGNPLRDAPRWIELLLIVVLGVTGPLVALTWGPTRLLLVTPIVAVAYAASALAAFSSGVVVAFAAPMMALAIGAVGSIAVGVVFEAAQRRRADRYNRRLQRDVREATADLRATQLDVVVRLARAAELRDHETGEHIERMSVLCERVGLALGMSAADAELLRHATILHDVGKIGTPDSILLKPGRLDPDERALMEQHTLIGAQLLTGSDSPLLKLGELIALSHHERWDGGGYPNGLSGEEIPLEGRIAAVCDVYDALISERSYKPAWSHAEARQLIADERGRHFDPRVADALLEVLGHPADAGEISRGDGVPIDLPVPAGAAPQR